jgi:hypothetical protein
MIPARSKLLLKHLPWADNNTLWGIRSVRNSSLRIAQFFSILGVSRGASGRRESPLGNESYEWREAHRSSVEACQLPCAIHPLQGALSSSGDLCLLLLLGLCGCGAELLVRQMGWACDGIGVIGGRLRGRLLGSGARIMVMFIDESCRRRMCRARKAARGCDF